MKRTSARLIFMLVAPTFFFCFTFAYLLYEAFSFIIPIRLGGIWGLALGLVISWTLYFSIRHRFPKVVKSANEVKLERSKNPMPQLIAARISVLALAITRSAALVIGFYAAVGFWAVLRRHVEYLRTIGELSLLGVGLASGILIAGLMLERLCSPPSVDGVVDSKQAT